MSLSNFEKLIDRGNNLMISTSGVRGRVPAGLDPVNIVHFARAFAAITGKKIVIGNDARPTGPLLRHITLGTLLEAGKEVIDIGLAPTPTVKAAIKELKADAGIMFSASHNPPDWNAFKFLDKGGFFFNQARMDELMAAMVEDLYPAVDYKKFGRVTEQDGIDMHIKSVLKLIPNIAAIKKKKYKVVVDAVAGAGRDALPRLLKELGCKVVPLFCEATPKGEFPRPPEPNPAALRKFGKLIKDEKAAVGFALDPDADRLVTGSPGVGAVHEEYTLPLALLGAEVADKGKKKKKKIIVNMSTSTLIDQVAEPLGHSVERSAVGEANVVEMMRDVKAAYGGEGNGGVIHPAIPSYGRDTLSGSALILSAMADANAKTLDDLLAPMPALFMEKTKMPLDGQDLEDIYQKLRENFPEATVNTLDGLHLSWPDKSWLHVRGSNTEPIMRLMAQAPTKKSLAMLVQKAQQSF